MQPCNSGLELALSDLIPHFSPAKRAGDFIFFSGQLPFTSPGKIVEGEIEAQTAQCLLNIEQALTNAGAQLVDVVKNMVWLTNTEDFARFNKAYAEYFPESPPARATVCSALMVPGALIEIESVAYKPLKKEQ
jgi:2-iminobutanoate/2-iminopropanoate deaminase